MVTLTFIGPLYPWPDPVYTPSLRSSFPIVTLPARLPLLLLEFDELFTACTLACCFEPAFWIASATAIFSAFDETVAPEMESTFTLPVLKIWFITA